MRTNAPYFIILLCLTPDDFTHQGESLALEWVKLKAFKTAMAGYCRKPGITHD
jgi:hypothetical protein